MSATTRYKRPSVRQAMMIVRRDIGAMIQDGVDYLAAPLVYDTERGIITVRNRAASEGDGLLLGAFEAVLENWQGERLRKWNLT